MKISYNKIFQQLLSDYNLPENLEFCIDLPPGIQKILGSQIIISENGVTLEAFSGLYKARDEWENQSIVEDNENHFHVDRHIVPEDNKLAFMLGIRTIILLAEKFKQAGITGTRFWYHFQTPELGLAFAKHHNLHEEDDEHFISDRLSFFTRREREHIIEIEDDERFSALLIIDI